jgi:hypothetical protein
MDKLQRGDIFNIGKAVYIVEDVDCEKDLVFSRDRRGILWAFYLRALMAKGHDFRRVMRLQLL